MAEARVIGEVNWDRKFANLQREILKTFEGLFQALEKKKQDLLARLSAMKTANDKNIELDEAIKQLRISKEKALASMTSNLLGEASDQVKATFDNQIRSKEEMKVSVENVSLIEFRCLSEQILKAITETDLVELIPEYVGRENPILNKCSCGAGKREFQNPKGIAIDRMTNEVYIADKDNHRIQIMNVNGDFVRSFTHDLMKDVYGICLSENDVFITDRGEQCILKFTKSGRYLKKAGSRGATPGCFNFISGLCYDEGLVYVCDGSLQKIRIFNCELKFLKRFDYGESKTPVDINIHSNIIYIMSLTENEIYCYNKDCDHLNTIQLTGQKVSMTLAVFFTIDSRGNFLVSDHSNTEIRIFSSNGVLKHTLGRGHLKSLYGIVLDINNAILCVNSGLLRINCFQKY